MGLDEPRPGKRDRGCGGLAMAEEAGVVLWYLSTR